MNDTELNNSSNFGGNGAPQSNHADMPFGVPRKDADHEFSTPMKAEVEFDDWRGLAGSMPAS